MECLHQIAPLTAQGTCKRNGKSIRGRGDERHQEKGPLNQHNLYTYELTEMEAAQGLQGFSPGPLCLYSGFQSSAFMGFPSV